MHLSCPRCDEKLNRESVQSKLGRADVDWCNTCGGIWLDRGEAERVCPVFGHLHKRAIEIEALGKQGGGIAGCPRCRSVPYAFLIVDAEIDYCIACGGVWLDQRESIGHVIARRSAGSGGPYRAIERAANSDAAACVVCKQEDKIAKMYMSGDGLLCNWCHGRTLRMAQLGRAAESNPLAQQIVSALASGLTDFDTS